MWDLVFFEPDKNLMKKLGFIDFASPDGKVKVSFLKNKHRIESEKNKISIIKGKDVSYCIKNGLADAVISSESNIENKFHLRYQDSGLTYYDVRFAKENGLAIIFSFNDFLKAKNKSIILSRMFQNAFFVRKYKADFVICSGAIKESELVGASELLAFGEILGFQKNETKKALSVLYERVISR